MSKIETLKKKKKKKKINPKITQKHNTYQEQQLFFLFYFRIWDLVLLG